MPTVALRIAAFTKRASITLVVDHCRAATEAEFRPAMDWANRLVSDGLVDVPVPSAEAGRRLGENLLRQRLVGVARLIIDGVPDREAIPKPPPPPDKVCPICLQSAAPECNRCGWQRFPSDRTQWAKRGACPRCGFTHRWDGARCSHCGYGTIEVPPAIVDGPIPFDRSID